VHYNLKKQNKELNNCQLKQYYAMKFFLAFLPFI